MDKNLQVIVDRIQSRSSHKASTTKAVTTGLLAGVMMVIMTVTYASLIFSRELKPFLADGISLSLTSVIVVGSMLVLFSSSTYLICQIDDDTSPVYALLLSMLAASLPAGIGGAVLLTNLLAGVFLATLVAGSVLTIFGLFKLGSLVQFLPYSVMGGYFAAVGWLLFVGAISMMSGVDFTSWSESLRLFEFDVLMRWLPALLLGSWLYWVSKRWSAATLFGSTVVFASLGFYLVQYALGHNATELMAQDLLLGPFKDQSAALINPVNQLNWQQVEWAALSDNIGSIASITLISLLSIILGVSGIGLVTREDLDINHELKVSGAANMLSGLLGGMSALPSLTISNLSFEMHSGANRLVGFVAVLVAMATFYVGMPVLAHIPKMVLGALLIYISIGFAVEWIIEGYRKFGALEFSVIPIILAVSIFAGFLQSIMVGVGAAIVLFVIKYSRIKVVRYSASGAELRSNLVRDSEQSKVLEKHGELIGVFILQGYLFFGTAGSLYQNVMSRVDDPNRRKMKYVVLDFSQVIGVDSSATLNFEKLVQRLSERQIILITTSLRSDLIEILRRGGVDLGGNANLIRQVDVDQGLEWCENEILSQYIPRESRQRGIFERINDELGVHAQGHQLSEYLMKMPVTKGQVLMNAGEDSEHIFFLESCTASACIIDSKGSERRVSGAGRGAIYGEIGFFLGIKRTALVRVDTDGDVYVLSKISLAAMEKEAPELAAAISRYLTQVVTERLVTTTQALRAVL